MKKRALIIGISGQDGTLLTDLLLNKNYEVYGTSRDFELNPFKGLKKLNLFDKVQLFSMVLNDFRSVLKIIDIVKPDEIYNLAGQTSVGYSFNQPVETIESIVNGCLNVLESVRFLKLNNCKIFNACSSECFGNTKELINEKTCFNPISPYAVSKVASFWLTSNYRNYYNIFTCSGILSNHESFLRSDRFVTMKIIGAAKNIHEKKQTKLQLGDINIIRDWGSAEEYVQAMHLMLQQDKPDDFIIATGLSISLKEFINYTFKKFNLDFNEYLEINQNLIRPSDIEEIKFDISKISDQLGWKPKKNVYDVIDDIINKI